MSGDWESSGGRNHFPRRPGAKVIGPAIAAGAVSLGLVLLGSCHVGQHDEYVAPPPIDSDLSQAPTGGSTSSTAVVRIPPSPSWRVAVGPTPGLNLPIPFSSTTSGTSTPTSTSTTTVTTTPYYDQYDLPTYPTTTSSTTTTTDPFDYPGDTDDPLPTTTSSMPYWHSHHNH